MKRELAMSYNKIKKVSLHANSNTNLVLRQRCAMVLIALLKSKKRLINIDETWLGMSDFRRMKW